MARNNQRAKCYTGVVFIVKSHFLSKKINLKDRLGDLILFIVINMFSLKRFLKRTNSA